jgi:flagellar hook-length control protein FliK
LSSVAVAKSSVASSDTVGTNSQNQAAAQSDAGQLQIADAAAAQNSVLSTGSARDTKASTAASSAPAGLAQLLQSGTNGTLKTNGSAATADPSQPVLAPNGLVKALTLARTAQDVPSNKTPGQITQSENTGGIRNSATKQDASTASATTALGLSSAASSAEAAAAVAVNQSTADKGPAAGAPSQGTNSPLSISSAIANGANATTAAELNAVTDQLGAVNTTVLATDTAAGRTAAETNSATARTDSGDSAAVKPSDKDATADSVAAAEQRAAPAALTVATPPSSGPTATSSTNATGPATSPSGQSAQELANRVADSLRSGFDRGGALRVQLEPPALGKVQIEVQADSGAVSARLEVQTPAARQTLLDNISLLHDAIGQTGATVNRIEIEVVPQRNQDSNNSDNRDSNSGAQQQDPGQAGSQNQSNNPSFGSQRQNQRWRPTAAIDEIDIEI